jgi:uncharacterized membrane protein YqgA involved in biofilm formation
MYLGTFINALAIIIGSCLGAFVVKNIPEKYKIIAFQGLGLSLLLIGFRSALQVQDLLVVILSIVVGGLIGEYLNIEKLIENLTFGLKKKLKSKNESFNMGFSTAFVLFCTGAMGIIGSINQGTTGDLSLLYTKSIFDGFSSIALASVYGTGVLLSFIPLIIVQTVLTALSHSFSAYFTDFLLHQVTATGGLLIVGVGLNILEIKKIKVVNFLPAIIVVVIVCLLLQR